MRDNDLFGASATGAARCGGAAPSDRSSLLRRAWWLAALCVALAAGCGGARAGGAACNPQAACSQADHETLCGYEADARTAVPATPSDAAAATGGLDGTLLAGSLEVFASFDRMPSGVAAVDGRVFVSMPRWVEAGDATVFEIVDGRPVPYPPGVAQDPSLGADSLVSVNGLRADARGWLWIVDNGRVDLRPAAPGVPKLVVWDTRAEREVFRHVFAEEVSPAAGGFLNDVVVDARHGFAYLTESGMGGTPALIAFNVLQDRAARVLVGHASVVPAPERVLTIDGEPAMVTRPDGEVAPWRVAANTIGLSPDGQWLYYGPLSGDVLYRLPTRVLRDATSDDAAVEAAVEVFADKPASDGMAVAVDGRLYVTDVEGHAVVEVASGAAPRVVASDGRMVFPVAVAVDGDTMWVTSNQLHLAPLLHGGVDRRTPPFLLWRARLQ